MAAGFMGLLNATMQSGFDVLNSYLKLEHIFKQQPIHYLITGEGKIDAQTAMGKLPQRIAQFAKQQNPHCKTIGLCGSLASNTQTLTDFDALFSIVSCPMDEYTAIQHTPALLAHTLESILGLT